MSFVANSVLYAGLGVFRSSFICCVSVMSRVVAEWCPRKPCYVGDRRMCGVMFVRTILSSKFEGVAK